MDKSFFEYNDTTNPTNTQKMYLYRTLGPFVEILFPNLIFSLSPCINFGLIVSVVFAIVYCEELYRTSFVDPHKIDAFLG